MSRRVYSRQVNKMVCAFSILASYPLPAKGGTPPILRGERHADLDLFRFPIKQLKVFPIEIFNGIV